MGDHQRQQRQGRNGGANGLDLPPGFRFHPSDEEIITSYLRPRVLDHNFTALAIGEADLNKSEPWELPSMANMGENEWYFYCQNDRKYSTGARANRATESGYWKATGKDREIYRGESTGQVLVGMKKTLVFYEGRAPKGVKTNWVMHEYRLPNHREWVVCRVFHKCSSIQKIPKLTPASEPAYNITTGNDNSEDLRSMSFPMPANFPIEPEDFIMYSSASFYSIDDTSSILPALSPMTGMGSMGSQMNTKHFGGTMATTQSVSFCQQVAIGTSSDCGFMVDPNSRPTSMLSDDLRVSPDQTNVVEISSAMTAEPVAATTANIDSIWKY